MVLEPRKIKSDTVSTVSPSISHEVMGPDAMILVFWMLSFKPTFSLSSFTFIKRLFSSSSLSAIRVVSSACLRLLLFLPAILILACASSPEIEENNRMGKTRDIFKKIRDTKGTFHAKMGLIKDRNGMGLTEAEDIKRWQEYWSGLLCPPLGNLPDPGIEPMSPKSPALAGKCFTC